jgi:hypothetical protein
MRWGSAAQAGTVREPVVAGRFYTGRAERLAVEVDGYVQVARAALEQSDLAGSVGPGADVRHVAVVVPHAGHIYSGPVAAFAYAAVDPAQVRRVVLLGPAHYVPLDGIGVSRASAWRTPLGDVALDGEVAADLRARFDSVAPADSAHAPEHSLEVQLPFLQRVLRPGWRLVPLIVGADLPEEVAAVIAHCAGLPETLVVVSTDLSHYLDHDAAVQRDGRTIRAILERRAAAIGHHDACGRAPLRGLLLAAADEDWTVRLLDARNSGDTAGDWDRVVGYAALLVTAPLEGAGGGAGDVGGVRAAGRVHVGDPRGTGRRADLRGHANAGDPGGHEGDGGGAAGDGGRGAGDGGGTAGDGGGGAGDGGGSGRIAAPDRARLLALARSTIEHALDTGRRRVVDPEQWDGVGREPGAAFVTLRSPSGGLLGCIGSLAAHQPLAADVAEHAYDAAFRDPRFPPLDRQRSEGMVIDISVLSRPRPFPCVGYDDLVTRLPEGSGLVVTAGRRRATFLPAVWEQLPDPGAFVAALWRKAGLDPGAWPQGTVIEVYDSEEFAEPAPG